MAAPTRALVLAAGLGTRLRPLTFVRAKPAIPVGGEPIMCRILRWLASSGTTDVVINLHYLPATLTGLVGDGSDLGLRVRYSWEQPVVLGSAGGPRQALDLIAPVRSFLIVNGDSLSSVNVETLADAHESSDALVTLALTVNRWPLRYGGVRLDRNGCVIGFSRPGPESEGSFHFVGVQMARPEAFAGLPRGRPVNSIGDAYDALLAARAGSIRGFVSELDFFDIGTVADYLTTNLGMVRPDQTITGRRVQIDRSARVSRSILWDDIEIGRDAALDSCVVTDGVRIPNGAAYSNRIIRAAEHGRLVVDSVVQDG
jgi:NDP-sugar pyrophosphorylase family protein